MKLNSSTQGKKIKVLIVDDSLVQRKLLIGILAADPVFEVVGVAENGKLAYEKVLQYNPDVVSMDIEMPVMDGIDATRLIMSKHPVPVVIVSSIYRDIEIERAIQELEAGAVTILPKPYGPGHPDFSKNARKYINTLKLMSEIKVVRRNFISRDNPHFEVRGVNSDFSSFNKKAKVLAIGASAGGPEGVRTILSKIDPAFPLPILLVQHIDPHFAEGFVLWLNTFSKINVKIAVHGERITAGNVYLPPGDKHLRLNKNEELIVSSEKGNSLNRPSIDVLFASLVDVYNSNVIAILLSGMGKDGAQELKSLKNAGSYTFVQDEESCLVFGMPGEAVKLGAACSVMSPQEIVDQINNLFTY